MNSHEIEPAVRLNLHLVVLLLRDDAYGMIKWKQENMDLPEYGLDFSNPDFVKYAESYGAHGHRISKADELLPTLKFCLDTHGVHIIDVPVDYSENTDLLGKNLAQKTAKFLKD